MPLATAVVCRFQSEHADHDDAIQEALLRCLRVLWRWDPVGGGTAFNFFTSVIRNKQRDTDRTERRQRAPAVNATILLESLDPHHARHVCGHDDDPDPYELLTTHMS